MTPRTLRRLLPLIVTLLLGIFLTASYVKTAPKENAPCTESKCSNEKKPRSELMIWQALSRHLLSLR